MELTHWQQATLQAAQIVSLYRASAPRDFDPQAKGPNLKPPAPPAPPAPSDASSNRALRLRMERLRHAQGFESTILTRGQQSTDLQPDTLLSKLLGG